MASETIKVPPLPSRIGKRGSFLMPPDGQRIHFTITDEIRRPQSDLPTKVICLQRVTFDDGRPEVRLGYYIIGKKPGMRGKWVWGQYATCIPLSDLKAVIAEAESKGWF